jgi:hypothetical protein
MESGDDGETAMADETEEPGERQDPDLPEIPPGSDVSADDPGPIEIVVRGT